MAQVRYENASHVYPGADRAAVSGFDLDVADGEFVVLVGPSGCGKSTALRMLAGLEDVTDGAVYIGDQDVTGVAPKDRDIAMVFQNYALYPHLSVADNMAFALKVAGVSKAERRLRVEEAAKLLDLGAVLDRKPKALSGGQRQRVAMGRAIVRQPQVFLMDEPLSNLDAKLRVSTRTQIAALQRRLGVTTLYVTHDQIEAMTMGDRVAVMKDGELQQVDTPLALYDRPANAFVAGFIGSPAMNLLSATTAGDGVALVDGFKFPIPRDVAAASSGELILGVRPEAWRIAGDGEDGYPVTVLVLEELGADGYLYAAPSGHAGALVDGSHPAADGEVPHVVVRLEGRPDLRAGQEVRLVADPDELHIFDAATGGRLGD
ncbi:sn-glycerol-3-phosphate ABC transporter ATP-binding protein UgpC [Nocardioides sp. YIM 152588]|uniref:ABC transporter ATP-binding protein n=1 Tax=Nocardioides sp. YIM 152588 TaxID=3158259 RepID=UPI0032E4E6BD